MKDGDLKNALTSIQRDVLTVRQDIAALRDGLEQAGLVFSKLDDGRGPAGWQPPVLKKLGDMIKIIAGSNPTTAKAFEQEGFDTTRDPSFDPEVDPNKDPDRGADLDTSVDTDPNRNPRDLLPAWLGGDNDPNTNVADKKRDKKADPIPPNTRDDANPNQPLPDTTTDSLS